MALLLTLVGIPMLVIAIDRWLRSMLTDCVTRAIDRALDRAAEKALRGSAGDDRQDEAVRTVIAEGIGRALAAERQQQRDAAEVRALL